MEIINLTSNDVQNIASNSEIIGQGSNGILYNIDNEILFKFNYKKFIDCFCKIWYNTWVKDEFVF